MARIGIGLLLLICGAVMSASAQPPGYPSREPQLDVLPGFRKPPPGYGEVAFYWWLGDPLTRERLIWHLDQLRGRAVSGLQVNYAHSDKGGQTWGLTYPSEPPLFSEPWWNLFGWFMRESRQRGMAASLSDYTLGPGQGSYFDEIIHESPQMRGSILEKAETKCSGACEWQVPEGTLAVAACRDAGCVNLVPHLQGRSLKWRPPEGEWRLTAVFASAKPFSLDPMHPASGRKLIEKFFQRFEDRNPGESGKGLNFFFSDELDFGVKGRLWNASFRDEFRRRKGYDILPDLPALFVDTGPRTPKIRLDYSDVMVALEEENYFRPVFEWHRTRGMLYGCDHGGRGRDVTEFGDYFRTQRWTTGPGNDQPNLTSDVIKNKVASSIAHLYERPRTWLEGYYGSGWGTTTAQVTDATFRNFAMGHNLLTLHGMYYSTHGGWWEWAPPDNHLKMPYWTHMDVFLRMAERLSYLLSQGVHRADVAIVYPVAPMEAGLGGKESVDTAFDLGRKLYGEGVDFDFIDFESLARAQVVDRELRVAGERYRILILPAMRALRWSTLEKAVEFQSKGGAVVLADALPEASDRAGRSDPQLDALVRQLASSALRAVSAIPDPDFTCNSFSGSPYVLHRSIGAREVYFVYGVAKGTVCTFRATGTVELWDPWTGRTSPLSARSQTARNTTVRMPLGSSEAQIIVFSPGRATVEESRTSSASGVPVTGPWEFELKPALDNRWGDFRLPATTALIGAEARRFRYKEAAGGDDEFQSPNLDDSSWPAVTSSYGPAFRLPNGRTYDFSWRFGVENDPGHQGYHGLKGEITDDFIALGSPKFTSTSTTYQPEPGVESYHLASSVYAPRALEARVLWGGMRPGSVLLNGEAIDLTSSTVRLHQGANSLELHYSQPGRAHLVFVDASAPAGWKQTAPLAMRWFAMPGLLPFDARAGEAKPAGWYRFLSPPGLRSMTITARGTVRVWAGGQAMTLQSTGRGVYRATVAKVSPRPVVVSLRIEQERGFYGGAALPEPIALDCAPGSIDPGDWSRIDGLASYSGGAWYRKTIRIDRSTAGQRIWLDLGNVASTAEVRVNGKPAGTRVAPPWRFDITGLVAAGDTRVEVLVYNTLANHYVTIPTRYRGDLASGLLGPVTLEVADVFASPQER